jgi:septal ring factor EnvC (AmiA/AmiB activator)
MEIVEREKERLQILEQKYSEEGKELTGEKIDTKELQESIDKLEEDTDTEEEEEKEEIEA